MCFIIYFKNGTTTFFLGYTTKPKMSRWHSQYCQINLGIWDISEEHALRKICIRHSSQYWLQQKAVVVWKIRCVAQARNTADLDVGSNLQFFIKKKKCKSSSLCMHCIQVITRSELFPTADTGSRDPLSSVLGTQFCIQQKPYQCPGESGHASCEDF